MNMSGFVYVEDDSILLYDFFIEFTFRKRRNLIFSSIFLQENCGQITQRHFLRLSSCPKIISYGNKSP